MLMPYTAEQMYEVVNDVESYAEFLPGCESSEVLSESDTEMMARLTIAKGGMRKAFTTRSTLTPPETIRLELVEGPFSTFSGMWQFTPLGDEGCRISMDMEFSFDSRVLNITLGRVFTSITERLIDAFCERADQLYS